MAQEETKRGNETQEIRDNALEQIIGGSHVRDNGGPYLCKDCGYTFKGYPVCTRCGSSNKELLD